MAATEAFTHPRISGLPAAGADSSAPWPGLATAASAIGVGLSADAIDRFGRLRDLLRRWNDRFNLTAIDQPDEIERRLFLDAISMLPMLDEALASVRRRPGERPKLVDIGSGAGFPGLPIAICRPDLDVTMVEATGKKVRFIDAAIVECGLTNARALHDRAEEIAREPGFRGAFDAATARAVGRLPTLIELAMPLLRIGGVALFPKGLVLAEELPEGEAAATIVGGSFVADEVLATGETRLVVVRKQRPTPTRFPRRSGIPTREPLGRGRLEPVDSGGGGTSR